MDGCKKYLPHDIATIAYLLIVILLIFLFGRPLQDFRIHITNNSLVLISVIITLNIINHYNNKFWKFVHYCYPLMLFMFLWIQ